MELEKDLRSRGLIDTTSAEPSIIFAKKRTVYLGVDPTADSMQAGNLVVVLLMKRLAYAGHNIILLVGGGTGMIGDPKEKGERPLIDARIVSKNKKALKEQFQQILGRHVPVVDNADWLLKMTLVDFLRDIGKHFSVNELIKRDVIKRRLTTDEESISYTEFAYSLLQGYDYLVLHKKYGCDLQIGASDQWTNILSGVDLIRRKESGEAFALTCPLVTDATGKKFGKSEGNAIWLDPKKTSPYSFYQFWLNQGDTMVDTYLKFYTFLPVVEIDALIELHRRNPGRREAQRTLARLVTEIVHGKKVSDNCVNVSEVLYGERSLATLTREERTLVLSEAPTIEVSKEQLSSGFGVVEALVQSSLSSSKTEARRLIEGKGVSVNGVLILASESTFTNDQFENNIAMLRRGKQIVLVVLG
jgi:tyrosyl-tRNA synthetase